MWQLANMSTVSLEEAKRRLGELVQSLPTEGEIVITDGQRPVAKLALVPPGHSAFDIKPRSAGGILRPYPNPDDDTLGEMLESKLDQAFPRRDEP
jgi:antitoxin (DNA-binding transcriptional repressor) of toxin-antitoxin stability system